MAAGRPAEDAVFVLKAGDVGVAKIQEVGRSPVGVAVLLLDLEPHLRRVIVAAGDVVDREDEAVGGGIPARDRGTQVVREGGDATLAREVVAEEGDLSDLGIPPHGSKRSSPLIIE